MQNILFSPEQHKLDDNDVLMATVKQCVCHE